MSAKLEQPWTPTTLNEGQLNLSMIMKFKISSVMIITILLLVDYLIAQDTF